MSSLFDDPRFNRRLFFPRPELSPCPPGAVDSFIDVPDARLHARTWRRADARHTLLYFHGNGEVVSDYDDFAERYLDRKLALTVFEFRGYGGSTGAPTFRALLEDALACVEHAPRLGKRIIFGRSLGAACAAHVAHLADAVVIESGGSDLQALLERRNFPRQTLTAEERDTFDPLPKWARCTVPALVLHGERDELIRPEEARGTFAALGSPQKQFVLVPGRGHNDLSFSPVYDAALDEFVARL